MLFAKINVNIAIFFRRMRSPRKGCKGSNPSGRRDANGGGSLRESRRFFFFGERDQHLVWAHEDIRMEEE